MRKSTTHGMGRIVYMEWIVPVIDYYRSIRKNEVVFEVLAPLSIAVMCTIIYLCKEKLILALDKMADLLPTAISILIGFTAMLITLLLTSSGESINKLKEAETGKKLYQKPVSLFQGLHIQFSHSLFSEIALLLIIFFYLFLQGLGVPILVGVVFLIIEIYLTLNILLSILRGITSIYFSFYNHKTN